MKGKFLLSALFTSLLLLLGSRTVLAHESITIGSYQFEIGWVQEPPIVGQQNGIILIVSDTSSGEAQPVEDVSTLEVTVSYGGQSKALTLQPVGKDTPGQFMAPIIPTIPGEYRIVLGGNLGETGIEAEVHPEEVVSADVLQFPGVESSGQTASSGTGAWLVYLSILIAVIALALALAATLKSR